jgi:preprotein translocase subunit SecB
MAEQQAKQLILQKIYIKDLSFESPMAPAIFNAQVTPQTQLNMRSSAREVGQNTQEVTLTLTVEAKDQDSTLFLVEIAQAGIFTLQGYNEQERAMLIGSYCPSTLYPYAREAISDIVVKGGFPQLLLQPINFDALYMQAMQQRQQQAGGEAQPGVGLNSGAQPAAATVSNGDGAAAGGNLADQQTEARPDEKH